MVTCACPGRNDSSRIGTSGKSLVACRKESVTAVPTGLLRIVDAFPTLKRGANELCAYGARVVTDSLRQATRALVARGPHPPAERHSLPLSAVVSRVSKSRSGAPKGGGSVRILGEPGHRPDL